MNIDDDEMPIIPETETYNVFEDDVRLEYWKDNTDYDLRKSLVDQLRAAGRTVYFGDGPTGLFEGRTLEMKRRAIDSIEPSVLVDELLRLYTRDHIIFVWSAKIVTSYSTEGLTPQDMMNKEIMDEVKKDPSRERKRLNIRFDTLPKEMNDVQDQKLSKTEFQLIELATSKLIETFTDYNEARLRYRFFKNGGSWAGWTPDFINRNVLENV